MTIENPRRLKTLDGTGEKEFMETNIAESSSDVQGQPEGLTQKIPGDPPEIKDDSNNSTLRKVDKFISDEIDKMLD